MTRTQYTFASLAKAAKSALEDAAETRDGRFWKCVHAIIMSAFSLEALLNHIGQQKDPSWDEVERSLSPREKADHLYALAGRKAAWGERPLQSFTTLFRCRNFLAHGKTMELDSGDKRTFQIPIGRIDYTGMEWEAICADLCATQRLCDDAREAMDSIHQDVLGKPVDLNCLWIGM